MATKTRRKTSTSRRKTSTKKSTSKNKKKSSRRSLRVVKGKGSQIELPLSSEERRKSSKLKLVSSKSGTKPAKAKATSESEPKPLANGRRATAESLAAKQQEISVSEFFTRNRHLLGFDNPQKALLTTIKEAVDKQEYGQSTEHGYDTTYYPIYSLG